MRLPNGYGSVTKLSGKRRRPYWVRKTIGFKDNGQPIYLTVGYAKTKKEGLQLLAKYNEKPWNIDAHSITVGELYQKWLNERAIKLALTTQRSLKSAYNKYVSVCENITYVSIRAYEMQKTIDDCTRGASAKGTIKTLWGHLDRFAFELDIIDKKYSESITAPQREGSGRVPFTAAEVEKIWDYYNSGHTDAEIVLMYLYTGFRFNELRSVKISDIDLEAMTITGGLKTKAGKNRVVPIHRRIQPIIKKRYIENKRYLLTGTAHAIRKVFESCMMELNMAHVPHECRHTFETFLDSKGGNRKCIDLLMGHVSKDIGNRVYNHKTLDELRETIELLD